MICPGSKPIGASLLFLIFDGMIAANINITGVNHQYSLRTVDAFTVLTARITNVNIAIVHANSDLSRWRACIESEESSLWAQIEPASCRERDCLTYFALDIACFSPANIALSQEDHHYCQYRIWQHEIQYSGLTGVV